LSSSAYFRFAGKICSICRRWFISCPAVMRTICPIVSCPRSECIPQCFHCSGVSDLSKQPVRAEAGGPNRHECSQFRARVHARVGKNAIPLCLVDASRSCVGSWRVRTKASSKSLPPADSAVRIRCGVHSRDPWEPHPTSIAVSSTVLKGALNCCKIRLGSFNADGF